jgi:hypothetical protein
MLLTSPWAWMTPAFAALSANAVPHSRNVVSVVVGGLFSLLPREHVAWWGLAGLVGMFGVFGMVDIRRRRKPSVEPVELPSESTDPFARYPSAGEPCVPTSTPPPARRPVPPRFTVAEPSPGKTEQISPREAAFVPRQVTARDAEARDQAPQAARKRHGAHRRR